MRALAVAALLLAIPALARAQEPVVRPALPAETLTVERPSALLLFGRLARARGDSVAAIAAAQVAAARQRIRARLAASWGRTVAAGLLSTSDTTLAPAIAEIPAPADTATGLFGDYADLDLRLDARIEAKGERNRNERCASSQLLDPTANCDATFQPQFDFQFAVVTGGVLAERVHLDVDYDSEREFDASNNISIFYEGGPNEVLQRLEVGNVSFQLPTSRFITSGIPSGNYGVQAIGQVGSMRIRTIVAQQKGNVVSDRVFTVGDRTLQAIEREIEDYQIEPRRFFWTVDPSEAFPADYPNIDIVDDQQMIRLAASLPDSARPKQVFVYRLRFGGQPVNPNGPQFVLNGDPTSNRGQVYDLLQEGVDYYIDPSQLWIALVRPLGLGNERLVVAYRTHGPAEVYPLVGGTPDLRLEQREQRANLVWDPSVQPGDAAFDREIRSVYRLGGEDIQRHTVSVKVVTGSGGDQEKPAGGSAESYLAMFGLAQATNPSTFDVENRLWPRPSDPNRDVQAPGTDAKIIRDYFLVFPSLRPLASDGLVQPGNPANDSIYTTPAEDLYSSRHPQSLYRIRVRYESAGGTESGTLALGSVQLRQGSERILVDGVQLERGTDYTVDYQLGRVTFARPDTLFPIARTVTVRYEENPLFATAPTSIFGLATEFPMENGQLTFTAIQQSQRTTFNRPPLGFEPASALIAGVGGNFTFDAAPLTRALDRLPMIQTTAGSRIDVQGEFATSRPQPNSAGQAYVESFEGEGGIRVPLDVRDWYYSSQPAGSRPADGHDLPAILTQDRAATLAWQSNGYGPNGFVYTFRIDQIDPRVRNVGTSFTGPEDLLWLTLYPLSVGGLFDPATGAYAWTRPPGSFPTGVQRWRSIRTSLGPTGVDLTRIENLQFWTLVDTAAIARESNPILVFDFGEISENSLAFAPESLSVTRAGSRIARRYSGRRPAGLDELDTERDPFSRAFNVDQNDVGLPGDLVNGLVVTVDTLPGGPVTTVQDSVRLCTAQLGALHRIGDTRDDCTAGNSRLDEEDLDLDLGLNLTTAQREQEQLLRYVVDLTKPESYDRIGACVDTLPEGRRCWVHVRLPFGAPDDTINDPLLRRIRSLRLTMISGPGAADDEFVRVPIARLRLVGAPWLKRDERPLAGIAGQQLAPLGQVVATLIGTQDSTARGIVYQSPPGVSDQPEDQRPNIGAGLIQINEQSMRLLASQLAPAQRAEAYFRFPEGEKSFMGYEELHVWARGRGSGWGDDGELQFFVKIGRDADNFYLRRAPAYAGDSREAWRDVVVRFQTLYDLRAEVQNAFLQGSARNVGCTGVDLALIEATPIPAGKSADDRYTACRDGYMVYTLDPNVTPPNLAAVQELSVGMVRVASGSTSPTAIRDGADTLEVWVNDIRLAGVVDEAGYAGQIGLSIAAADVGTLRLNLSRQDPNFRQLGERPSFIQSDAFDAAASLRLEKFLPAGWGVALPFTASFTSAASDPFFVSRSDVRGSAVRGLRAPKSSAASYVLRARKTTPLEGGWLAPVVNNLTLSSTYSTSDVRSEYQTGGARSFTAGLDYAISPRPVDARLGWLDGLLGRLPDWLENLAPLRAMRESSLRLNPSGLRFTSEVVRASDHRTSYLKPAAAVGDVGSRVDGLSHLWRNGGTLELRPFAALGARWQVTSLRDLRDYGHSTPNANAATEERARVLGMDVGLERERTMITALNFTPAISSWITPRLDVGTQFTMLRDPNAPRLLSTASDAGEGGELRLPRRLTSSRTISAGAVVDLGRAITLVTGDSSIFRRLAGVFQPIDVNLARSLVSAFDGTPFTPGLGYQLGFGEAADFREVDGRLATNAGRNTTLSASNTFVLPFGASILQRVQRVETRSWTRRLADRHAVVDGRTVTFPDLNLRWNYRPAFLGDLITSVGAQAGVRQTVVTTFVPSDGTAPSTTQTRSRQRSLPVSGSIAWSLAGGLVTSGGYNVTDREDDRPGSHSEGSSRDWSASIARSFRPPASWDLQSDIRAQLGYQSTSTSTHVDAGPGTDRSRLADNGRRAVSLNADTDVAENMTFSLQGSRVITFDRNFNRRFTQTVVTAVLRLQFFAGEL